jgi:hypothetical protein
MYCYCKSDPADLIDPLGLEATFEGSASVPTQKVGVSKCGGSAELEFAINNPGHSLKGRMETMPPSAGRGVGTTSGKPGIPSASDQSSADFECQEQVKKELNRQKDSLKNLTVCPECPAPPGGNSSSCEAGSAMAVAVEKCPPDDPSWDVSGISATIDPMTYKVKKGKDVKGKMRYPTDFSFQCVGSVKYTFRCKPCPTKSGEGSTGKGGAACASRGLASSVSGHVRE